MWLFIKRPRFVNGFERSRSSCSSGSAPRPRPRGYAGAPCARAPTRASRNRAASQPRGAPAPPRASPSWSIGSIDIFKIGYYLNIPIRRLATVARHAPRPPRAAHPGPPPPAPGPPGAARPPHRAPAPAPPLAAPRGSRNAEAIWCALGVAVGRRARGPAVARGRVGG